MRKRNEKMLVSILTIVWYKVSNKKGNSAGKEKKCHMISLYKQAFY